MKVLLPLCGVLMLCTTFLASPGSPGPAHAEDDPAGDMVEIELGREDVEIDDLLRVVRKVTGVALVWNPEDKNIRGRKIIGGVRLRAPKGKIFAHVRSLLMFYELVFIPLGAKEDPIWAVMDARRMSSILKPKPRPITLTDENLASFEDDDGLFVTTTIAVEHMNDLRNARNALTRIVTGSNIGHVTEVPATKSFVVTDFAPNVVAIYRLLRRMDRPSAASSTAADSTVAIKLEHARAEEAASTLAQLFASTRTRVPGATGGLAAPRAPRIVADGRANQLLVAGSEDAIAKVRAAVALVDVRVAAESVVVEYVKLEHAKPAATAEALSALVATSPGLWRAGRDGSAPSIVADSDGGGLLIAAATETMAAIRSLVEALDAPR